MKVPNGMIFHAPGGPYEEGDDIPDDVLAALPSDHPLKTGAQAPPAGSPQPRVIPRPAPSAEK